jgi:DmsE family decaheme c-type cytochrome
MTGSTNRVKFGLTLLFVALFFATALTGTNMLARSEAAVAVDEEPSPATTPTPGPDHVGSETCAACHDVQAKHFADTKHAKLGEVPTWKNKVQGCESCHGPGRKHVEDPTIKGSILSFKVMDAKAVSETCLSCHAGKETHNNFRRGEHWRNNVGCTDCHAVHGPGHKNFKPDSNALIGRASVQRPNDAQNAMLHQSEPSLCISCHSEVKAQFSKPFRHKVLEGAMKCSDCHNPHGGFEQKQTKLAVGADQACIRCHSNKQGPFVFEHAPLKIEGCATCHNPHGSSNAKMLKRTQVRQTCIECHTGIHEELSPQLPSRHNQAQFREQQCTVCHSAIHGSNSSRLFFR